MPEVEKISVEKLGLSFGERSLVSWADCAVQDLRLQQACEAIT
jgi:hypothetical protein